MGCEMHASDQSIIEATPVSLFQHIFPLCISQCTMHTGISEASSISAQRRDTSSTNGSKSERPGTEVWRIDRRTRSTSLERRRSWHPRARSSSMCPADATCNLAKLRMKGSASLSGGSESKKGLPPLSCWLLDTKEHGKEGEERWLETWHIQKERHIQVGMVSKNYHENKPEISVYRDNFRHKRNLDFSAQSLFQILI